MFRPVGNRVVSGAGWFFLAALQGFAIGLVTAIADEAPFFLGFTRIAWITLVVQVLYGIVYGATVAWIERR